MLVKREGVECVSVLDVPWPSPVSPSLGSSRRGTVVDPGSVIARKREMRASGACAACGQKRHEFDGVW